VSNADKEREIVNNQLSHAIYHSLLILALPDDPDVCALCTVKPSKINLNHSINKNEMLDTGDRYINNLAEI